MSIVRRTVYLGGIEPGPLSFRAAQGLDTNLDVVYLTAAGGGVTDDVMAQLQLTSRSDNRSKTYAVAATDVVNGKARAIIPANDLSDPNGYRLRMVGAVLGEPTLLAMGLVTPIDAAGFIDAPVDTVDSINLTFEYDEKVDITLKIWMDSSGGTPYDLTSENTIIAANIYDHKNGAVIMPFTITAISANTVTLTLTVEQVNSLPAVAWWNLQAAAGGALTTLCEGSVTTSGTITPPLTETIFMYDYQKPDDLNPVGGQIIHGNFTRNLLKVAKLTSAMADATETLRLVRAGDQIVISLTTWTVISTTEQSGWFEYMVQPVQQAGVTGVNPVTFRRP